MKRLIILTFFSVFALSLCRSVEAAGIVRNPRRKEVAGKDSLKLDKYTAAYLDTVQTKHAFELNDYLLLGVEGGASVSRVTFSPPYTQTNLFVPGTYGVFFICHSKLFGYIPNFGFKIGARCSHQGYKFKENKETGKTPTLNGATQAIIDFIEVPFMAHIHADMPHFKVMADAGIYGGYRKSIERTGPSVPDELKNGFLDTDRRYDYGLCGGVGFGVVFDPVEFHVNANVRYAWGNLYDHDYYSKDYFRFAYPFDVMVTAGVYFQLTKRSGKSKGALRKEAYDQVYNPVPNESTDSQGR